MLRAKVNPNYGSTGEHKIAGEFKNLSNAPEAIFLKVSEFISYESLVILSNLSKSMQNKTSAFENVYRRRGILYFRERQVTLNHYAFHFKDSIYESLERFQRRVRTQNHVNIFSEHLNFLMAISDQAPWGVPFVLQPFSEKPMGTFGNYVQEMDRELTRYQWSPRSFIACTGKIVFEEMEVKLDGNCVTKRCNKPCCFNVFCDPTLWLRWGTPEVLIGGATALLCPVPCLTTCLLEGAVMNCAIGLPARIAHEYRLHKTRKEFENLEIVRSAKQFMFFQKKERALSAGMVSIFTPEEDLEEPRGGPNPGEMQ